MVYPPVPDPKQATYVRCDCSRCGRDGNGFKLQSRQTRHNHQNRDASAAIQGSSSEGNLLKRTLDRLKEPTARPEGPPVRRQRLGGSPSLDDFRLPPPPPDQDDPPAHDGDAEEQNAQAFNDGSPSHSHSHSPSPPPPPQDPTPPGHEHDPPVDAVSLGPRETMVIPAFREHPQVRLAYLHTVIGNSLKGMTERNAEWHLETMLVGVREIPGAVGPHRPTPAKTLKTVKRRLRLDPDEFIQTFSICTECYRPYSLEDIDTALNPGCVEKKCKGVFYKTVAENRNGTIAYRKYPVKTLPYSSPIKTARRFMARPGFADLLRDSRADLDRAPLAGNQKMHDVYDGIAWVEQEVGLERVVEHDGQGGKKAIDRPVQPTSRKKIVEYRYGLNYAVNLDWFGAQSGRNYSIGALYLCMLDLPRAIRYKQRYIALTIVVPGPKEPSLLQLNNVLRPLADDFIKFGKVVYMWVHNNDLPVAVPGAILFNASDTPASRKIAGQAAHSHKLCPCPICEITLDQVNVSNSYRKDQPAYPFRKRHEAINAAFNSIGKPEKAQKKILDDFGVRHTEFNRVATWWGWDRSIIDLMHNGFLNMVSDEFDSILVKGIMLSKEQWRQFDRIINSIIFPSHAGRLPKNIAGNPSLKKADELRTWSVIAPAVLFLVWKNDEDCLPENAAPIPSQTKERPKWTRNPKSIFKLVLRLSVALRILALRAISMDECRTAVEDIRQYCQLRLSLGIALKISHHLALHYPEFFSRFGPGYATWLFAFETFNGLLKRIKTNRHGAGEMELTLMRGWLKPQLLTDLLASLPSDASTKERELIGTLVKTTDRDRGTYQNQATAFEHIEGYDENTYTSKKRTPAVNLRTFEAGKLYYLLLAFARSTWPDLNLVDDQTVDIGQLFIGRKVAQKLGHYLHQGTRYGCLHNNSTDADRHVLVEYEGIRQPAEIHYIFRLRCLQKEPVVCLIARRFRMDDHIPEMPWNLRAVDLGYTCVYTEDAHPYQVFQPSDIAAPAAFMELPLNTFPHRLSLFISWDRSETEPQDLWDDEGEDLPF